MDMTPDFCIALRILSSALTLAKARTPQPSP